MKKTIVSLALLSLVALSCKKEEKKVEVTKEEKVEVKADPATATKDSTVTTATKETTDGKVDAQTHSYTYQSAEGKTAQITFINTDTSNTVKIESEGKSVELPRTDVWAKGAVYEKDGVKVESTGDKIKVTEKGKTTEWNKK